MESLLGASLQSSLATIDVICEHSNECFAALSNEKVVALNRILDDINSKVENLRERINDVSFGLRVNECHDSKVVDQEKKALEELLSSSCHEERITSNSTGYQSKESEGSGINEVCPTSSSTSTENKEDSSSGNIPNGRPESRQRKLSTPMLIPMQLGDDSGTTDQKPHSRQRGITILPGPQRLRKVSRKNSGLFEKKASSVHPFFQGEGNDKDNGVSRRTLSMAPTKPRRASGLSQKDDWMIVARDAFNIIDVNNDGFLQKEEVIEAISMIKETGSDGFQGGDPVDMAEKMMKEVDIDGDGQIDINEFVQMMKNSIAEERRGDGIGANTILGYNQRMSQLAKNVLVAHQKKLEESVVGNDTWMIHPLGSYHATWDIIVSALILITVITMPLSLGWESLNDHFFGVNLAVDFIFLLDVCKNFCTGFVDENDAVIMDAKIVRRNYLSGFFFSDVCSSLPLDLIFKAAGMSDNGTVSGTKQSLKMLRLLRMAKLFRLLRISRLFRHVKEVVMLMEERLNIRISDGFTKLIRLGIGALILGHWIGCFNFMLVRLNDFPSDSWVVYAGLEDKDAFTQWSWSFFKALAQMIMIGFETPPFTNASCDTASYWCGIEHWITLGCLYLGAVFYSLLISSISSILQSANLARRQFEEKLMQIDDYMRNKKLPSVMREKVKDYFHLQHSNGKMYNENEILDMVTPILRREIKHFNSRDISLKVPLLSTVTNKEFAGEMITAIEPTIAFTNEIILREKTTGEEMFFINSGVVEIFLAGAQPSAYVAIGDGCYFGEVSLLLGIKRTASARTKTQCMLYKIDKESLMRILQDFPGTASAMKTVAQSRQRRLLHYIKPKENPLYAMDEVDGEDRKTDLFGVDADQVEYEKEEEFGRMNPRQSHRISSMYSSSRNPSRQGSRPTSRQTQRH